MPFFEFPHTRTYDSDLGWIIQKINGYSSSIESLRTWAETHNREYQQLLDTVEALKANLTDPVEPWDGTISYKIYSMVSYEGDTYLAIKDVPAGVLITNPEYWVLANTIQEQLNAIIADVREIEGTIPLDAVETIEYLQRGDLNGQYCRIPFVEHSETALLCGGDVRSQGLSDIESINIAVARSEDEGRTWQKQIVLTRPTSFENSRVMDGCIAVDRYNNRIYVFGHYIDSNLNWATQTEVGIYTDCVYRYSDDNGQTWSEQLSLRSVLGNGTGNIITCFAGVGKGIYTSDDRLVIPYVEKRTDVINVGIFYTTNHGQTWIKSNGVNFDSNEPQIVEYDGYIYINARNIIGARSVYRTADYGQTWEYMPEMSTLIQPFSGVCCGLDAYPQRFGKVFTYSGCDNKSRRGNIVIKQSRDLIRWTNVYQIREAADGANGYTSLCNYEDIVYCVSENDGNLYVTKLPKASVTMSDSESLLTIAGNADRPANLNNYIAAGTYTVDQSVTASTGLNFPESQGGILTIIGRHWDPQIFQRYTTFNGISYERALQFAAGGSTWTPWRRITLGERSSGEFDVVPHYETETAAPTLNRIQSAFTKYGPIVNFFWRGNIATVGVGSSLTLQLPWTFSNRSVVLLQTNRSDKRFQNFAVDRRVFIRNDNWSATGSGDLVAGMEITIAGTVLVNE